MFAHAERATRLTVQPTVIVVDDDVSVRESLELLIGRAGWRPKLFSSAQAFLAHPRILEPACLLLDMALPGLNGLDLQRHVSADQPYMPIIFITAYGDVSMTVRAMKGGAFEFLTKPLSEAELLSAICKAIDRSQKQLNDAAELRLLRERYDALTPRERDVMRLVACGLLNKQIGDELGISVITVKAHRGSVMRKMAAGSLADLVKLEAKLRLAPVPRAFARSANSA